jgi:phospholipid transport system substrate-binding protein
MLRLENSVVLLTSKFLLLCSFFVFGYFYINDTIAQEVEESPEKIISTITGEILDEIKNDPDLAAGDWAKINKLVDTKVMPVIDFKKMTSLAVGRHWRSASDIQKTELMKVFRKLLLLTYSGAIRFADKADMKILPPRRNSDDVDVVVRTRVTVPGRQAVPIDYRLRKTDLGWRIFDLNVLGLWLIENYRAQFSQIVNRDGIAGLISAIQAKNKSLSQSKK